MKIFVFPEAMFVLVPLICMYYCVNEKDLNRNENYWIRHPGFIYSKGFNFCLFKKPYKKRELKDEIGILCNKKKPKIGFAF